MRLLFRATKEVLAGLPEIERRFDEALNSLDPLNALRDLVSEISNEGYDKAAILEIFEKQRQRLRSANKEAEEDVVTDVMDFLVGWCSPHMKLLSDEKKAMPFLAARK